MSLPGWFDLSTNANKLRNSYLKGFLDISGGSVMLRSDNSMNFFKGESTTPKFSIGPDDITAPGPDLTPVKVSTQSIGYLTGLTQNVQSFINALQNNNDTDLKVANINATDSTLSGNLSIAQTLVVGGNANFRSNVLIEGDAEILGNEYVHKALIVGGNCTIDGSLIVKGDVSMGDFHLEGSTISAANQLDVGGNIVASASLNFSRMQLNSNFVVVPNISGNANVSVDVSSISCLKNLTSNVQAFIDAATTGESNFAEVTVENQTVNGNLTIGSTLVVGGNAAFRANVLIEGDAEIMGNEYVHKALIVGGNCTIDGSLIVKGDVSMNDYHFSGSTISAANDVNVGGELSVTGDSAFANDLTVGGHLTVKSITIGVAGDNSSADENSITFNQPFYVASDVSFGTTLNVDALATLHSASVTNDASVGGDVTVTGSYNSAAGNFTLTSGNVSANKITSTGLATLESASVTNNASVGGNVSVTGSYTSAAGDFTLTSGNVSANKIASTGLATLHSASVTNDASVGGNVTVTGNYASTAGNVSAYDITASHDLKVGAMTMNTYNTVEGDVNATLISTTGSNLYLQASGANGRVVVSNDLKVEGNVTFTGTYTTINTTIEATKMFDISNNGTGVTLEVGQEDLTTDIAYFMQGNFPVMKILKQRQIAIGRADASTNYLLDVCGNVYLREKLTVDNIANFASAVNVSGKLTTGSFECNDTLTITGTSTFAADVAVNAKLTTTTFESTGIATFGDDATFNDNMYLSGAGNFDMTGSSGFLVQFA